MSWAQSHYDENPFSVSWKKYSYKIKLLASYFWKVNIPQEGNNDKVASMSAPLTKGASKLDTPPWLQEPSAAPIPTGGARLQNSTGASSSSSSGAAQQSSTTANADTSDQATAVPRMILYTRIINLVLSVCMIVVSLLSLLTTQSATTGVLACYLVVFACLLCCFETHLKQVSKVIALNFGFMYSARARSVFMLFVGEKNSSNVLFFLFYWVTASLLLLFYILLSYIQRMKIMLNYLIFYFCRFDFVFDESLRENNRSVHGGERCLQCVYFVQIPWLRDHPAQWRAIWHQGLSSFQPCLCQADHQRWGGYHQEQPRLLTIMWIMLFLVSFIV